MAGGRDALKQYLEHFGTSEPVGPEVSSREELAGNINLAQRPIVYNPDGSYSTVRTATIEHEGKYYNVPTVMDEGRIGTEEEAYRRFLKTGKHLGAYRNLQDAVKAAEGLHEDQAADYEGMFQEGQPTIGPPGPRPQVPAMFQSGYEQMKPATLQLMRFLQQSDPSIGPETFFPSDRDVPAEKPEGAA